MKITQSLIKEVLDPNHCPKQIYFSFIEGRELMPDPSENLILGRFFESELLGACRGGEVQEPRYLKGGEIAKPFADCLELVDFAKSVFVKLGLDLSKGKSQIDYQSDFLKGAIDHENFSIENPNIIANYDLKWTATKEDDVWNGWGNPENKADAHIQARHYTLLTYELFGEWRPFYFLVFGKDKWVKVIRMKITTEGMEQHKELISHTTAVVRKYAENDFKGNGSFNKCLACPFYEICPDKSDSINIETITI